MCFPNPQRNDSNVKTLRKEVHHSQLKIIAWNIEGIKSRLWGNKLKSNEFLDMAKNHDIIGLTETHALEESLVVPGFTCFQLNRRNTKNLSRGNGGIAVFVKHDVSKGVVLVNSNNENILWLKLKKTFFGTERDIFLGTVYFSPKIYETTNKLDYINDLENDLVNFSSDNECILMGDFNARTGNQQDTIEINKVLESENLDQSHSLCTPHVKQRNSEDIISDNRGNKIIELCSSFEMSIINGRKIGDSFGRKTCYNWNGSSVVDYVISSNNLFDTIRYFYISSLFPTFSIHCPLSFGLNFKTMFSRCSNHETNTHQITYKYKWSETANGSFLKTLKSDFLLSKVNILKTDIEANSDSTQQLLEKVNSLFDFAADMSGLKIKTKSGGRTISKSKPWFDTDCKEKKIQVDKFAKFVKRHHNDQELNTLLYKHKKQYKQLVKSKRRSYKHSIVNDIKSAGYNPKTLWSKITNLHNMETDDSHDTSHISTTSWLDHFSKLGDGGEEIQTHFPRQEEGDLDYLITVEELKAAVKKLKNKKSPGYDQIINEMIKCFHDTYPDLLLNLFNYIFVEGKFPTHWSSGMIVPIYKKGAKNDPSNYRGITLSSCLGKLFCSILNNRLNNFIRQNNILGPEQLGFVAGNRTSDAIYILHSLIEKYCKLQNQKLYVCFIDFEKAFDKVSRTLLLNKLHNIGLKGKFLNILTSIYSEDKACLKLNNSLTDLYPVNIGVKQGCVLSPTLFNLFLSDLPSGFNNLEMHAPKLLHSKVSSLFWADDLALISTSLNGLQVAMNKLKTYSEENKLSVNINKTKFMIFNKTGRLLKNQRLFYDTTDVELVRNFVYLGIKFCSSGTWSETLRDLKARGLRAYAKIRKLLGNLFTQDIVLSIKLFDALVRPILLYCSDIWGNSKLDEKSPIEQVHIKFCKQLLQVGKQTSNIGVKAELGRISLTTIAKINSIKNWIRISQTTGNIMVYKIYKESLKVLNSWANKVKDILFRNGLGDIWLKYSDSILNCDCQKQASLVQYLNKLISRRFIDCYNQTALTTINDSAKLRTYTRFKCSIKVEEYLNYIKCPLQRKYITKLRLSNHKLAIETGRYTNESVEKRLCTACNVLEDEFHLLLKCQKYNTQRESMYNSIIDVIPKFIQFDDEKKFELLFTCERNICNHIGTFLETIEIFQHK